MKKRILVLTTVLLAIGLSACGGGSKPAETQPAPAETEAPYVEETPAKRKVVPSRRI